MTPEQRWQEAIEAEESDPTTDWIPNLGALRRALDERLEEAWRLVIEASNASKRQLR